MANKKQLGGALVRGAEFFHDVGKDKDKLFMMQGSDNLYHETARKVIATRLKNKQAPGIFSTNRTMNQEIDNYINSHPDVDKVKEELKYNDERKKVRSKKALAAIPAGIAVGTALPFGAAALIGAAKSPKGKRLQGAIQGAKAMVSADVNPMQTDLYLKAMDNGFGKKLVPKAGALSGLAGGTAVAVNLNNKYRDKVYGKVKNEASYNMLYDLDKHMNNPETIDRIVHKRPLNTEQTKTASELVDTIIEKKAGLKRDLRIARAEAKADKSKLMYASFGDNASYKKDMSEYADAIESFLNSKDRHVDWEAKKELANLGIARGESSKVQGKFRNTPEFVNKAILKRHANKDINASMSKLTTNNAINTKSILEAHPDTVRLGEINSIPDQHVKADLKERLKNKKTGGPKRNINTVINASDPRLAKIQHSGIHKKNFLTAEQLKQDGVYFKSHDLNTPFNLTGHGDRYLKRDIAGSPKMPKKGVAIWASKLPEVSTTYGDNVLAFKPNKEMLAGASVVDHPHLATDTRRLPKTLINMHPNWNDSIDINKHPEYERVFTYNKKNMDNSTVATYRKYQVSTKAHKKQIDGFRFMKNKPGSLKDLVARQVVNGKQDAYDISPKDLKKLDKKALKRKAATALTKKLAPADADIFSRAGEIITPSKLRQMQKNHAFKNNVALGVGLGTATAILGHHRYKQYKDMKERQEFAKKKQQEEQENKKSL